MQAIIKCQIHVSRPRSSPQCCENCQDQDTIVKTHRPIGVLGFSDQEDIGSFDECAGIEPR